jgi:hypothetical protein
LLVSELCSLLVESEDFIVGHHLRRLFGCFDQSRCISSVVEMTVRNKN